MCGAPLGLARPGVVHFRNVTFERKIVVGLEEIRAITFECHQCKSRLTVSPDDIRDIPTACPHCNFSWRLPEDAQAAPAGITAEEFCVWNQGTQDTVRGGCDRIQDPARIRRAGTRHAVGASSRISLQRRSGRRETFAHRSRPSVQRLRSRTPTRVVPRVTPRRRLGLLVGARLRPCLPGLWCRPLRHL